MKIHYFNFEMSYCMNTYIKGHKLSRRNRVVNRHSWLNSIAKKCWLLLKPISPMKAAPWIFAHYIKKSTIFAQSLWNLVEMIILWVNNFHQVTWESGKNCRSYSNEQKSEVLLSYVAGAPEHMRTWGLVLTKFWDIHRNMSTCPDQILWQE